MDFYDLCAFRMIPTRSIKWCKDHRNPINTYLYSQCIKTYLRSKNVNCHSLTVTEIQYMQQKVHSKNVPLHVERIFFRLSVPSQSFSFCWSSATHLVKIFMKNRHRKMLRITTAQLSVEFGPQKLSRIHHRVESGIVVFFMLSRSLFRKANCRSFIGIWFPWIIA